MLLGCACLRGWLRHRLTPAWNELLDTSAAPWSLGLLLDGLCARIPWEIVLASRNQGEPVVRVPTLELLAARASLRQGVRACLPSLSFHACIVSFFFESA